MAPKRSREEKGRSPTTLAKKQKCPREDPLIIHFPSREERKIFHEEYATSKNKAKFLDKNILARMGYEYNAKANDWIKKDGAQDMVQVEQPVPEIPLA
ncbi:Uncharacterized protein TCM_024300 [Theobroma cacao]|uniref:Uncharacterized protein n=1 Tax=Theobroma cacao TaxID=3641 RepID=A0A061EV49_THECC|nr:Uncharacterized protein TCM_024300 [Theobroma cacao]